MVQEEFAYPKLRGRIIEKFRSYANFARAIDEDKTVVSRKLTGTVGFTRNDILKYCEILDIPPEDIGPYFFDQTVHET